MGCSKTPQTFPWPTMLKAMVWTHEGHVYMRVDEMVSALVLLREHTLARVVSPTIQLTTLLTIQIKWRTFSVWFIQRLWTLKLVTLAVKLLHYWSCSIIHFSQPLLWLVIKCSAKQPITQTEAVIQRTWSPVLYEHYLS